MKKYVMLRWLGVSALAALALFLLVSCGDDAPELSRADVEQIVQEGIAGIPEPETPLSREDAQEIVQVAIADIPEPEPGLTMEQVGEKILAAIPDIPEPEHGITAEQVERIVQAAIASIPEPEPGLSMGEVEGAIRAAIDDIPKPKSGLSMREVENAIQDAIDDIPEPEPGLSREEAGLIARSALASIPPRSAVAEYTKFFVNNAVSRYESEGLEATLAYYSRPDSVDEQWYVFIIDENDFVIAHPSPEHLGLDLNGWVGTDDNGYNFGPEMLSATEEGKWVSYVFFNPEISDLNSGDVSEVELKNVWVVRHDGLLFASGWYVNADEFTMSFAATAVSVFRQVGLAGLIAYFASPDIEFAGLRSAIDY